MDILIRRFNLPSYGPFHNRRGEKIRLPRRRSRGPVLWLTLCLSLLYGCAGESVRSSLSGSVLLSVEINGFSNDEGEAIISLFRGAEGFPENMAKAWQNNHAEIVAGQARTLFSGLPSGEYAVGVLHDENRDGEMESSLLGQPREGFGFSGHPRYNFGPPSYEDTSFVLLTTPLEIVIKMRYETVRKEKQAERRADQDGKP